MKLNSIDYIEFKGTDSEWALEGLSLGQINLLVGRNATGKTRVINIISSLANMFSGKNKEVPINGYFDVHFTCGSDKYHYVLEFENFVVTREDLHRNDELLLHRGGGGIGRIFAEEVRDKIRFQISGREVAVVAKLDAIQHPFLQPLHNWGTAVRHFEFGKSLGHSNLAIAVKKDVDDFDESNTVNIVAIYSKGLQRFNAQYTDAIKSDMGRLGYSIEDISIQRPKHLIVLQGPAAMHDLHGLSVKEKDLSCTTDQPFISQGMFRALSIIVQLNYSIMAGTAATILIDDIGEGLDYERSCLLIELLREKAAGSSIQLIMSTNDRFVMNSVPLEEWCVLRRRGGRVQVFNYSNSASTFERFKRTGLANFDFLTADYIEKVPSDGANGGLR
jgi:predicted ATPase